MKHARVINEVAVDVVSGDPANFFTPDVAAQFVEVPDKVAPQWHQLAVIVQDELTQDKDWFSPYTYIEPFTVADPADPDAPELTKYRYASWTPPNPPNPAPVPASVTMRQARLALLQEGLLDDVETAINALPEPQQSAARIEWEYSNEVQRTNGFVEQIAPALGLSSQQLDELFILAATL